MEDIEKGLLSDLNGKTAIDFEHIPRDWFFVVNPSDYYLFRKDDDGYSLWGSTIMVSNKIPKREYIWVSEKNYFEHYQDGSKPAYLT